jgi:hypothetical protein
MSWFSDKQRPSGDEEAAEREAFVQRLRQVLQLPPHAPGPVTALSEVGPPTMTATDEGEQLRDS